MKHFSLFIIFTLAFSSSFAQFDNVYSDLAEYQSEKNTNYWKNRKPFNDYWQQDVSYKITAKLNDSTEIITATEVLLYANNSPDTITRLFFRLIQNAFQPWSYKDRMDRGGKVYNKFGKYEKQMLGTQILNLKIEGIETPFVIDNTLMIVELSQPLLPGKTLKIEMDFKTYFDQGTMRRRMKRYTHNNFKHFDGVHWYPRLAVYDRKFKWVTDQHLGKEFYGDFGIYNVELSLPNQYICEASGTLVNKDEVYKNGLREKIDISNFKKPSKTISTPVIPDGTYKKWVWMANNVHDFAFTTDPTYRIGEVEWKGIKCIAIAQEENAWAWQPTAKFMAFIIKTYSEDFGMYEYPKIVAADARDGMEYPMITLDGGNWPGHQYVIAHEIGHNWFFGMVGNNETYRAALDEGFTQFLTAWSIKKLSGNELYPNNQDWSIVYAGYINHAINENTARLNIHSDHFNSAERHGGGYSQVYYKTATMLYNLQYVLGDELFINAMKDYFNRWKFCHPYEEDFRNSIINYTKTDLNWFFDNWLTTTKTIDYKVKRYSKVVNSKYDYVVKIKRKGEMHMPLDVTVIDKKGNRLHYVIPNTYFTKKLGDAQVNHRWLSWDMMNKTDLLLVQSKYGIKNVIIDTSGRLADVNRLNNSLKTPCTFKLERLNGENLSFFKFQNYWRPEVWYNSTDGIKAGLYFSGSYYNFKHVYSATFWFSTGILQNQDYPAEALNFNFNLNYKTRIGKMLDFTARTKYLDGVSLFETGFEKTIRNNKFQVSYKSFSFSEYGNLFKDRNLNTFSWDYFFYPQFVNTKKQNSTINFTYLHPFKYRLGSSTFSLNLRNNSFFSDYNYSGITAKLLSNNPIGKKLNLHSRIFCQILDGDIPKECMLFASGANNEELTESKFWRSPGILPKEKAGFGNKTGEFILHPSGGLNIRGMNGYMALNSSATDTFYVYYGNKGISGNFELEFGKLFKKPKSKIFKPLGMNPYLFTDAGILFNNKNNSGFRADAGLGTTFTITDSKHSKIQPLVLRFDFPIFLNRVESGGDFFKFRFLFGINRCF
ncbi:MAG: M1 family metallopeptidase [Bacteroidia bacterium]|nr:M1 family metallopeptidase [Bacteroidia bacterium]